MINFIQICPLELFEQIIECDKLALSRLTCVRPMFNALIEAYVKKNPKGSELFVGEFRKGFIKVSDNYNFTNGSAYALTSI